MILYIFISKIKHVKIPAIFVRFVRIFFNTTNQNMSANYKTVSVNLGFCGTNRN